MKYCNNCGSRLKHDSVKFCPQCGYKLSKDVNVQYPDMPVHEERNKKSRNHELLDALKEDLSKIHLTKKQKIITAVSVFVAAVIIIYFGFFFFPDTPESSFCYFESRGEIVITHYKGTFPRVKIPSQIDGKPVTAIGTAAFIDSDITHVVIPDTVFYISARAFDGCSSLRSVEVPESVSSIGDYAFKGCTSLKSITIPGKIERFGKSPFLDCKLIVYTPTYKENHGYYEYNGVTGEIMHCSPATDGVTWELIPD